MVFLSFVDEESMISKESIIICLASMKGISFSVTHRDLVISPVMGRRTESFISHYIMISMVKCVYNIQRGWSGRN